MMMDALVTGSTRTTHAATLTFHTLVTRMVSPPARRHFDSDVPDIGRIKPWVDASGLAGTSALASSLGFGRDDNGNSHDWIILPIVGGVVAALVALSVFLLAFTKICRGSVDKGQQQQPNGNSSDNGANAHDADKEAAEEGGQPEPDDANPSSLLGPANLRRLLRLSNWGRFSRAKDPEKDAEACAHAERAGSPSSTERHMLPPAATAVALPRPQPLASHAILVNSSSNSNNNSHSPLASHPPQTAAEIAKAKTKGGLLRSNSLKRLSYGIRKVTDPIYHGRDSHGESGNSDSSNGDLCVYAASLPSGMGQHRGRAVRSECGRETQLKMQQSASSDECAVESASECSERASPVPDMQPKLPRHRQVQTPRSILKRPTVQAPSSSPKPASVRSDGSGGSPRSRGTVPDERKTPSLPSSSSYTPRWANDDNDGKDAHVAAHAAKAPARNARRAVRFGEDMVRRISVISTPDADSDGDEDEDDWVAVDSVDGSSSSSSSGLKDGVIARANRVSIQKIGHGAAATMPAPVLLTVPAPQPVF